MLGECYQYKYFEKLALQGDSDSQFKLGECYHHGLGIEKNEARAFRWYEKSAKQNDKDAQFQLGECY